MKNLSSLLSRITLLMGLTYFSLPVVAGEVRGLWKDVASVPTARQEVASAQLEGRIYVMGGLGQNAGRRVDVYDPALDEWTQGPDLPRDVHHPSAAGLEGHVYLVGGFATQGALFSTPISDVYQWDPDSQDGWIAVASLPFARGALTTVAFQGRLYSIGGRTALSSLTLVESYDPQADQWDPAPSLPAPLDHLGAAVIGDRIYVVGGRVTQGGGFVSNRADLFSLGPGEQQWSTHTPMPTARSGHGVAAAAGFLFAVGGEIPGLFDQNEVYDPASDRWFTLEPLPTPRHGMAIQTVGERIFVGGGGAAVGIGVSTAHEAFKLLPELTALAQYALGPNIGTDLLISNPSPEVAEIFLELRDDSGEVFPNAEPPRQIFEIQPSGTLRVVGGLLSQLRIGWAMISSDRPVSASLLFDSDQGFAGVAGRAPSRGFLVPILIDPDSNRDAGLALADASGDGQTVTLTLLDDQGREVSSVQRPLPPFGHFAELLSEIFPDLSQGSFLGAVRGVGESEVAAMALELQDGQLATLTVIGEDVDQ